ncbi:hypothetical protein CTRI78_v008832 [Colletotrichum trifolii]|uniref:Uncharacterized protein n=1 Tax=Colletotrichum trifolii TaxID=5466 RepID=A0A4R8QTU4_COLTR|nr:hypothetical protein CTRI78_v008832 [Colletotrichum trifolii]
MKFTLALLTTLCASLASAGVVITPVRPNQVIPANSGDCFFGVVTPQGCASVTASPRITLRVLFIERVLRERRPQVTGSRLSISIIISVSFTTFSYWAFSTTTKPGDDQRSELLQWRKFFGGYEILMCIQDLCTYLFHEVS